MEVITLPGAPDWPVVSQDPEIPSSQLKQYAEAHYLPVLIRAWQAVENETGYKWKSTSYWRKSPSHVTGAALDIAPDVSPRSAKHYAVTNMSDPVLYKREALIRDLQNVAADWRPGPYIVGIFIEPDHLHMQVFRRTPGDDRGMIIVKWKVPKPVYGDTLTRMKLPLITQS